MTSLASVTVASIVPFDPAVGIVAVASVAILLAVLIMSFLALAPVVSEGWRKQLGGSESATTVGANEAD